MKNMIATNRWGTFFGITQKTLDTVWNNLTAADGNSVIYISMEIGADRDVYHPVKNWLQDTSIDKSSSNMLRHFSRLFLHGPDKIPNYSGGLGILAGDTLKSFADLRIPCVAISLLYRKGYFSQLVDSRLGQISTATDWSPENTPTLYQMKNPDFPDLPMEIEVPFYDEYDREVLATARLWVKMEINATLDFFVPEILLDYSIPSSPEFIRQVSQQLYDSVSDQAKAVQRRLLGASVVAVKRKLGLTGSTFHLNEQHGVVLVLNLIAERLEEKLGRDYQSMATDSDILAAAQQAAQQVVFTIHTPVKAGHDRFDKNIISQIGHAFCGRVLHLLAQDEEHPHQFNFTTLAMRVNRATNSVSRLHKEVTRKQFPQFADKISAITNGVHHLTWISDAKAALYDSFVELKNWRDDPAVFVNAGLLLTSEPFREGFRQAWHQDTVKLIAYINDMLALHRKQMHETWIDPPNYLSLLDNGGQTLSPDVFTIGFARRFSTYKRADLIFDDIDALSDIIVKNSFPVNFIYAGKAHPSDEPGKSIIKLVLDIQEDLYRKSKGLAKLVFIPGYDMQIAKMMVAGSHAWLNSPKRPLEASGTSGMKAAMNGVPNISTMDGWWVEGYHDGKTGWKFGYEDAIDDNSLSEAPNALLYEQDSDSFYEIFPEILAAFYEHDRHDRYIDKCICNLQFNCPIFNTHRMAAEYVERYGLHLPEAVSRRLQQLRKMYHSDPEKK
ncbi:MAG: alpha-glucan family phosphorylase [Thermodesulfobacteriota bacterium]